MPLWRPLKKDLSIISNEFSIKEAKNSTHCYINRYSLNTFINIKKVCCNIIMARRLIQICNIQNDNEMSNDIRKRNIPSMSLQPQFSLRPVSTKYAHFPIVDTQISNEVPIYKKPYNVGLIFNPGNRMAPFSGFVENADVESVLRNQIFALQKNDQAVYVPS